MNMEHIRVRIVDHTKERQLLYVRDPELEPHLLYLRSSSPIKMVYSLNVGGGIVLLGGDENKRFIDLEVRIPRRNWKISPTLKCPEKMTPGDLEFQVNSVHFELDIPATALCDKDYSRVLISFGEQDEQTQWVSLSDQCLASIKGNQLTGFFIKLG